MTLEESTDGKPRMRWQNLRGTDDGSVVVLATDEEVAEYWANDARRCEHLKSELRDYRTSNGGWQRKEQCLTCGASTSRAFTRDKGTEVPPWDDGLPVRWALDCAKRQKTIEKVLTARSSDSDEIGYASYTEYLGSDEWKEIRERVFRRDLLLCQACLKEPAAEVHHLTYDHIFEEFMFELISVCRSCHERLHRRKIAAAAALRGKGKEG